MKKNTSCGCGGHDSCPPKMECDTVKSHSGECSITPFALAGTVEERVVLADVVLQTQVEADIKLPTFASDIKHIRKNVKLTQCKVIRNSFDPTNLTAKLFVEGFVHKNIQYAEDCHGCIKDFSVNVPFRCFQVVPLSQEALFPFGEFSIKNNILERREISKDGHGADDCTTGSLHFEIFTEPVQCKLLFAVVDEWDLFRNHDNWGRFNKITEKMDVVLGLKLFQLQQEPTPIPTPTGGNGFGAPETIIDRFRGIVGR
ncbi:CsxC family protein [Cytobacillus firmus]|uniref:CsxC family protein n=1 Tax=Cytobacillus firmus TaxID=1399 RepID=UPI0021637A67|nr:hypothetical protein [Cytobacillus firmus]MCS0674053.1 hypothetical protein [Cytobacillus firmus]